MIEKDYVSYELTKVMFGSRNNFRVLNCLFEEFSEQQFDLVIGNPPFGRMRAKTKLDK